MSFEVNKKKPKGKTIRFDVCVCARHPHCLWTCQRLVLISHSKNHTHRYEFIGNKDFIEMKTP